MHKGIHIDEVSRVLETSPASTPKSGNIVAILLNGTDMVVATSVAGHVEELKHGTGHKITLLGAFGREYSDLFGSNPYNPHVYTESVVDVPVRAVVLDLQYSGQSVKGLPHIEGKEPENLDTFDGFRQPV